LDAPPGVEIGVRERDGRQLWFVLNQTDTTVHRELPAMRPDLVRDMRVAGRLSIALHDVGILVPVS
jgi:hypothetical protein